MNKSKTEVIYIIFLRYELLDFACHLLQFLTVVEIVTRLSIFLVDGNWSDYTAVSWNDDCSTTCKCDYGVESGYKNRTCTNPVPAYGGKDCVGESFAIDVRQCTLKECPGNFFV